MAGLQAVPGFGGLAKDDAVAQAQNTAAGLAADGSMPAADVGNAARWTPSATANSTAPAAGSTGGTPGTNPANGTLPPAQTTTPSTAGPVTAQKASLPPASIVGGSGVAGPSLTPTDPANSLTAQTISAGPTADRFGIAQQKWDDFQKSTDPQYQATMRDAERQSAAMGGLGSGMLRTSLGDITNQRQLAMDTQKNNFLQDALTGSIGDAYNNVGIAQQQQGFQQGQQQNAFNQAITGLNTQDALTNSSFGRSLQQLLAGQKNNPSDAYLAASQNAGNQASAAGSSAASLIQAINAQNGGQMTTSQLLDYLKNYGMRPATTGQAQSTTSAYNPNDPTDEGHWAPQDQPVDPWADPTYDPNNDPNSGVARYE